MSAAVVDFDLSDGDGVALCGRLTACNIPFVLHSGYAHNPILDQYITLDGMVASQQGASS